MGAGVSTPPVGVKSNNPMQYESNDDKKATESDDDKKARLNVNELFKTKTSVYISPDDFQYFINENKLKKIDLHAAKTFIEWFKTPIYIVNIAAQSGDNVSIATKDKMTSIEYNNHTFEFFTPFTTGGRRIRRKTNKNKKTIKKTTSNRKTYRK